MVKLFFLKEVVVFSHAAAGNTDPMYSNYDVTPDVAGVCQQERDRCQDWDHLAATGSLALAVRYPVSELCSESEQPKDRPHTKESGGRNPERATRSLGSWDLM